MRIINFEFKAKVKNIRQLEDKLLELKPIFLGEDHQIDTYYNVSRGRLKLREGNIENALIFYERKNISNAKQADILLYKHQPDKSLMDILEKLHGVKIIVDKKRKIYFIENVKFHFDNVKELGKFIEVEAIDETGKVGIQKLKEQCKKYFSFFGLKESDYIGYSFSDLLLEKRKKSKDVIELKVEG